jgi:hypothetical protein
MKDSITTFGALYLSRTHTHAQPSNKNIFFVPLQQRGGRFFPPLYYAASQAKLANKVENFLACHGTYIKIVFSSGRPEALWKFFEFSAKLWNAFSRFGSSRRRSFWKELTNCFAGNTPCDTTAVLNNPFSERLRVVGFCR